MKKLLLLLLLPLILGSGPINSGPITTGGAGQALDPGSSPIFATLKLSNLSDGKIPYHDSDGVGLVDGPTKTDVDSAVNLKHSAVTIDGTSPLSISGQALTLKNDASNAITEVDTGALANSDTVVPTSKAVRDYAATQIELPFLTASLPIFTNADKKMESKTAANAMTALVGAMSANHKCFVNSAGNAAEWGESTYISSFTRDCTADSGNVTPFSDIGFTPRFGIFFSTHGYGWSIGLDNATSHLSMCIYSATWNSQLYSASYSINIVSNDGGASQQAYVSSWSANGPTFTWKKTGSPTGTATILAILFR